MYVGEAYYLFIKVGHDYFEELKELEELKE